MKEKLVVQQKNKQLQKLQNRLERVLSAEDDQLRHKYGFEYDETQGKWLQSLLDRKRDDPKHKQALKNAPAKTNQRGKKHQESASVEEVSPNRKMAIEFLNDVQERAKLCESSQSKRPGLERESKNLKPKNEAYPGLFQPPRPLPTKPDSELHHAPSGFLGSSAFGQFKSLNTDRYVLPVEHILVHKEIKKIYAFCWSGNITNLRQLFQLLQNVDQ